MGVGMKAVSPMTDEDLVLALRQGDASTLKILQIFFERHFKSFCSLAVRATGSQDNAEDLVQEVYVRVFRTIGSYTPTSGPFRSWLQRVVQNAAVDFLRRKRAQPDTIADARSSPLGGDISPPVFDGCNPALYRASRCFARAVAQFWESLVEGRAKAIIKLIEASPLGSLLHQYASWFVFCCDHPPRNQTPAVMGLFSFREGVFQTSF